VYPFTGCRSQSLSVPNEQTILGVGRSREMFTGKKTPGGAGTHTGTRTQPVPFCSKTPGHAGGAGTHTVPTLFIPRREIPRSRACVRVSGARARMARAAAGCAVDSTGHALYWLLGGEPNGKTEGEAKADFMRWSSGAPCNNMATCDVQRASERRGAREVGGQMLSRNAAQTIDVLGFCRSAICRSS